MRISSVKYLARLGVSGIGKNKIMSFASYCILLVSILLVGFSLLFTLNISKVIKNIESKNEIIVFLQKDISQDVVTALGEELSRMSNISEVLFYSKEEGFEAIKNSLRESGMDADAIFESLGDDNPLVDSYRVKIIDINKNSETISDLQAMNGVRNIGASTTFAKLLIQVRTITNVISLVIIFALFIVSMVMISNSMRTSVFARRKEIGIMKYVGATNSFIRIPFFIEGMTVGALSGLSAAVITAFSYDYILNFLGEYNDFMSMIGTSSNGLIPLSNVIYYVVILYTLAGAILGAIGTMISMRRHLSV
ncbi:MAG: permease-like cell division protein FtsX [Ruminococcus sp.]|jgi:cell division transport system permease protein|nr:permease-like cell division protein FtsX [Ruminococcus sp.]